MDNYLLTKEVISRIVPNDPKEIFRKIAQARLKDAEILLASRRYAGAVYLCGYAIALTLKAWICHTLKYQWE